jgi:PAS domain S-box-containing protein
VPLHDRAGSIAGWFGSATDIEELKRAQESLRGSEERLRVTMESAIDYAIITSDTEGGILGWSAGAERIFGYREEEVLGKNADIIFTPEDIAAGVPLWEMQTAREEGRAMDERWHQRRDGSRFFMSGVMAPIYNPALSGYVKVARDMTAERRAADALRQAEERQRIVIEAAELGTWDWNVETGNIIWNEQHYHLFGMRPGDRPLHFEDFTRYIHPDDLEAVHTGLRRAVEEPVVYQIEFRVIRADNGSIRWMSGYGKATERNEEGRATRMTGVMYDITPRKETEQRKEEFLGVASHELKTPITTIKAYAELLQDMFRNAGDEEMAEVLGKLDNQVDRLTQLIRDLLDATRINEGRLDLELRSLDINKIITEAVADLQRTTQKHQLKLELEPVPPVMMDHDRILQVLNNMLGNAIKYSPAADTVVVRSYAKEGQIYVCVQDFGVGLPKEATERVFERFFRAPDPAVRTFPGMGLGLYIAAEIIKQHKGHLWVESKKGEGSTFCFSLPLEA